MSTGIRQARRLGGSSRAWSPARKGSSHSHRRGRSPASPRHKDKMWARTSVLVPRGTNDPLQSSRPCAFGEATHIVGSDGNCAVVGAFDRDAHTGASIMAALWSQRRLQPTRPPAVGASADRELNFRRTDSIAPTNDASQPSVASLRSASNSSNSLVETATTSSGRSVTSSLMMSGIVSETTNTGSGPRRKLKTIKHKSPGCRGGRRSA